jgi:hypothetical protein
MTQLWNLWWVLYAFILKKSRVDEGMPKNLLQIESYNHGVKGFTYQSKLGSFKNTSEIVSLNSNLQHHPFFAPIY